MDVRGNKKLILWEDGGLITIDPEIGEASYRSMFRKVADFMELYRSEQLKLNDSWSEHLSWE